MMRTHENLMNDKLTCFMSAAQIGVKTLRQAQRPGWFIRSLSLSKRLKDAAMQARQSSTLSSDELSNKANE